MVKHILKMQEIKLCKSIGIAACPSNKIRMFTFAQNQARMPLYSLFVNFNCHRHYKRTKDGKRLKKNQENRPKNFSETAATKQPSCEIVQGCCISDTYLVKEISDENELYAGCI